MRLELKVSTIDAVRHDVPGHPLSCIIPALSSYLGHFGHFSKVHLDPLSFVVTFSNIRGLLIQSAIAWSITCAILQAATKNNKTSIDKNNIYNNNIKQENLGMTPFGASPDGLSQRYPSNNELTVMIMVMITIMIMMIGKGHK